MKLIQQLYLEAVAKGALVFPAYFKLKQQDAAKLKAAWPELDGRDPHLEVPPPSGAETSDTSEGWKRRAMYALYGYEGPANVPGYVQNLFRVVSYQVMMGDGPTLFDTFPGALLGVQLACRMYDFQLVLRESLFSGGPAQDAARERLMGYVKGCITQKADFFDDEGFPGVATLVLKDKVRACATVSQEQEMMRFLRSVKRVISGVDNELRGPLTLADVHLDVDGIKLAKRSRAIPTEATDAEWKEMQDVMHFAVNHPTARKILQAFRRPVSEGLGPIEIMLRVTCEMLERMYADSKIAPTYHFMKNVFELGDHETRDLEFAILVSMPFMMNMHLVEEIASKDERVAELLGERVPDKKRARTFCEQIEDAFDKKPNVEADSE